MLHQTALIALALACATPGGDSTPSTSSPSKTTSAAKSAIDLKPVTDKTFHDAVLKPRAGKAVLVTFWASYCIPCLAELPKLVAMKPDVQKAGGDIVFVNVDPPGHPADLEKALAAKGVTKLDTFQVANEDPQPFIDMIDKKWAGEVPFAAVYGKDGVLKLTFSGEQTPEDLRKAIDGALR